MRIGFVRDRPGARGDVDAEADGVGRHDDVAEQDGGVDPVAAHRLERDLGGEVRPLDRVEDAALAAQRPVLRQAAPGLAHEPHRRVRRRPPARRIEERHAGRTHRGTLPTDMPARRVDWDGPRVAAQAESRSLTDRT